MTAAMPAFMKCARTTIRPFWQNWRKNRFYDVLDCGCGTGPMIELLHEKYPEKHYAGLDLTPEMIHVAQAKKLSNTEFLVGDSENLPFPRQILLTRSSAANSFHHYPNPTGLFSTVPTVFCVKAVASILRDYTSSDLMLSG